MKAPRIWPIAVGVGLGVGLGLGTLWLAPRWGLLPSVEERQASRYVRQVLDLVSQQYVDPEAARLDRLSREALKGAVRSLDPHSEFLEAKAFHQLEEDIASQFGGIGVQVEMRKGRVIVVAPINGTPSDRAGVRRGDEIVRIYGERLAKPTIDAVVSPLRGRPSTQVAVTFARESEEREFTLSLVREVIKTESVQNVELLSEGIGYVQITQFAERTGEEFAAALENLQSKGARALVLDLRNNPGGLLDAAVEVASPFFKPGERIVHTQGRTVSDYAEYTAKAGSVRWSGPTLVLINAGSASAAEIVAGALKDTGRGLVLGERSFGKGSVQSILHLRSGEGLRLTTARYFTPSGVTLHERGVEPDLELVLTEEEDDSVRLQRLRRDMSDPAEFKERFGVDLLPDRQLAAALEVVKALVRWEGAP